MSKRSQSPQCGIGIAVAALAVSIAFVFGGSASAAPQASDRVLVQPRPGLEDGRFDALLRGLGVSRRGGIPAIDVVSVRVPEHARERVLTALRRNPHISFAEPDQLVPPSELVPDDPYFDSAWHLDRIAAPSAWPESLGSDRTVAVLDTGVAASHPDLNGRVLSGYNSVTGGTDSSDVNGHGTKVAGVVAAVGDNGMGVASLAWDSRILPVRVTDRSDGYAYFSDIASGLVWAAEQGADVANISYEVAGSSTVQSAAKQLMDNGGVVVVAAGNRGIDPGYADSPYLIAVSATDSGDSLTSWSNTGAFVDVSAPGTGIWTTTRGGGYGSPSGTSFSSPITAGVVALMGAANPDLVPADLERLLESSAVDLGISGPDTYYGHGRVDAAAAVAAASSEDTGDTEAPTVVITAPAHGASVSDLVTVDADAFDNRGVVSVELQVNGVPVATDSTDPWGFSWDSTTVADGGVDMTVVARDEAGNTGRDSVTVDVSNGGGDTEAPTVAVTSPADGAQVSGHVDIRATASDPEGIEMLKIRVDGKLLCAGGQTSLSCRWNSRKADAGSHGISAEATDPAGNAATDSVSVMIGGDDGGKEKGGKGNNGKGPNK